MDMATGMVFDCPAQVIRSAVKIHSEWVATALKLSSGVGRLRNTQVYRYTVLD